MICRDTCAIVGNPESVISVISNGDPRQLSVRASSANRQILVASSEASYREWIELDASS